MHLEFLLNDAMSISLSCDKRNTRFVLRFRASDRHLNVRSGIFAISQNISTVQVPGADSYRQAVLQGLLHAATPKKPPRPAATAGTHSGNETDALRLVEKVEHFVGDGGSDVQLAGRELASGLHMSGPSPKHLSDVIVQDLPFLKVVSRDRSHAAQRLPGLNTMV